MLEQEKITPKDPIPLFTYSDLYVPGTYMPKLEEPFDENDLGFFSYVGEYRSGPVYIIRPKQPNQRLIHFENRLIHQPTHPDVSGNYNFANLIRRVQRRSERILDLNEFLKHFSPLHRLSQETIRNHWTIISKILDRSQNFLIEPSCFLEVVIKSIDKIGTPLQIPIDAIGITHGGQIFVIEVATRNSEQQKKSRRKKYQQIKKNGGAFRKKFPSAPVVFDVCLFYEELKDEEGNDNGVYLSLRYPQLEQEET